MTHFSPQKTSTILSKWRIDSIRTPAYCHVYSPPYYLSTQGTARNNIDISIQQSRQLEVEDVEVYDHIYVMNKKYEGVNLITRQQFHTHKVSLILDIPSEQRKTY